MGNTVPVWIDSVQMPDFPRLATDLQVDDLVIGGGITGITVAYLLRKAGRKVALIDRGNLAQRDTGHTTAHVTCVTDTRLRELVRTFGRDHARAAWEAGSAAIEQIEAIVRDEQIACDFRARPRIFACATRCARGEGGARAARRRGACSRVRFRRRLSAEVPVVNKPGVRFANQAKFHPLKVPRRARAISSRRELPCLCAQRSAGIS
jgi:glycine/D-amino acid oxidase-like deaminating enzyme